MLKLKYLSVTETQANEELTSKKILAKVEHLNLFFLSGRKKKRKKCNNQTKLDGVGPVDNGPSTDKLHHFVKKKENVTRDM